MSFDAAKEITVLGYEGTEKESAKLLPLALSESDWQEHINQRRSRIRNSVPEPQFVTVTGTSPGAKQKIEHKFSELVGQPLDTKVLDKEVTKVWGFGRYSAVGYRMTEANGTPGLLIHAREKSYAPPFLNLALELNNTSTDVLDVNLRGRVTLMDILSEGSEVRLDGSIGSEVSLGAEYYYVIKPTHFFLAPYGFAQRTKTGVFVEEEQVAQYEVRDSALGTDLGYEFASVAELRIGYQVGRLEASREIGDPVLPEVSGEESEATISLRLTTLIAQSFLPTVFHQQQSTVCLRFSHT